MNRLPINTRRWRANLLLLAAAVLWGFAFTAQRVGAERVSPFTFNSVRFALGAALITIVILALDRKRGIRGATRRSMNRSVLGPGLLCGSLLTVAVGFQQAAMKDTSVGTAAFVTGFYLVLVPLLGVFLGHKLHWLTLAGLVIALVGLYFVTIKGAFTIPKGNGLMLCAAVSFAFHVLAVDRFAGRLPGLRFAASQFWFCAITSGAGALAFDQHPFGSLNLALVPLGYGGLISVGLAYTFQVLAQRDAQPTQATLIMSLETVFGALGGAWLLHESMGGRGYFGAALMAVGIVLSQLAPQPGPAHHVAAPATRPPKPASQDAPTPPS
ncbi:MAG: DMT family transporter [Bifidobacteriaceae bacterium]|nr:DMT family transporter [Bifidobacteriaceae bacterium]